jgi:hypothetical protein
MEADGFSKMVVPIYQTTQHLITLVLTYQMYQMILLCFEGNAPF